MRELQASHSISVSRRRSNQSRYSRRKKVKCDGTEPICGQCTQTNSTCTWIQTKDRAALSRQYAPSDARVVLCPSPDDVLLSLSLRLRPDMSKNSRTALSALKLCSLKSRPNLTWLISQRNQLLYLRSSHNSSSKAPHPRPSQARGCRDSIQMRPPTLTDRLHITV